MHSSFCFAKSFALRRRLVVISLLAFYKHVYRKTFTERFLKRRRRRRRNDKRTAPAGEIAHYEKELLDYISSDEGISFGELVKQRPELL